MAKGDYVWMHVTGDQLSIPLVVCDSVHELSRKVGIPVQRLYELVYKWERGRIKKPKYIRVNVEDIDDG